MACRNVPALRKIGLTKMTREYHDGFWVERIWNCSVGDRACHSEYRASRGCANAREGLGQQRGLHSSGASDALCLRHRSRRDRHQDGILSEWNSDQESVRLADIHYDDREEPAGRVLHVLRDHLRQPRRRRDFEQSHDADQSSASDLSDPKWIGTHAVRRILQGFFV